MSHLEWQILILDFHWAFLRLRRQRCRGRTKTLLISISPQLHNQENSVVARKSMVVSMGGCRWWESHQYLPWEQTTNFPTIHDQQIQDQLKTISKTVRTKAYIQAWILKIENRTCIVYYSSITVKFCMLHLHSYARALVIVWSESRRVYSSVVVKGTVPLNFLFAPNT